jgi:hypothetical protein
LKLSERRICRVLGQHRSTQRRIPRGPDDEERLTADIVELAHRHGRLGYRKIAQMLRSTAARISSEYFSTTLEGSWLKFTLAICSLSGMYRRPMSEMIHPQ